MPMNPSIVVLARLGLFFFATSLCYAWRMAHGARPPRDGPLAGAL